MNLHECAYKQRSSWNEAQTQLRIGETNPTDPNTDDDGAIDVQEGYFGTDASVDADTDDDGLPDAPLGVLRDPDPLKWDSDGDGLSDGLEMGVTQPFEIDGVVHTVMDKDVFELNDWPTFQAFEGDFVQSGCTEPSASCVPIVSPVDDPDWDDDGIIDGLEDLNHNGIWGNDDSSDRLGRVQELHPQDFDTDNDDIPDGRELLLYGPTGGTSIGYSFADVMNAWDNDLSELKYDSANPFETDPLVPDTDEDGVSDGLDLNPLTDAFIALEFGKFKMNERPDAFDWTVELYLNRLEVDLPMTNGQYVVETGSGSSVGIHSKEWTQIPGTLIDKLDKEPSVKPPSITNAMFKLQRLPNTEILKINLPDSGAELDLSDQDVTIRLWAKDDDGWQTDDDIDLNPIVGQGQAEHEFKLGGVLPRNEVHSDHEHLWMNSVFKEHYARDKKATRDEDGALKLRMGDNVPEHFLDTVLEVRMPGSVSMPPGVCYSGLDCV